MLKLDIFEVSRDLSGEGGDLNFEVLAE